MPILQERSSSGIRLLPALRDETLPFLWQMLFQWPKNGARWAGVAVVHQKRQAEQLIVAWRHICESQAFQDVHSRSKQSLVDVTNIVAVLCVADGDIVQAEKDNPFIGQVIGSGGIQINIIFNKSW